jgi:hypothetical protein
MGVVDGWVRCPPFTRVHTCKGSQMLLGLRGVGTTVLLIKIGEMVEDLGCASWRWKCPRASALPSMLAARVLRAVR